MPNRTYSSNAYRYQFNGKMSDGEVYGSEGTSYDYGYRTYNPRICRFLSIDPLTKDYPWYTPYQFAGNKPIWAIDLDGLEEFRTTSGQLIYSHSNNGVVYIVDANFINYQVLNQTIVRTFNALTGEASYELQYVEQNVNYNNYASGSLNVHSGLYQNLMNNAQRNDVGDAAIDMYSRDPGALSCGGVCVNSSYARMSAAYESVSGSGFPATGSDFSDIWKVWNTPAEERALGVREDLIMYGSPAAIDWANMGNALTTEDIWAGGMNPGNPVTYQGNPGHSFIFLGYTYDTEGNINGMNTWNQWNDRDNSYNWIGRDENRDLRGANINTPVREAEPTEQ